MENYAFFDTKNMHEYEYRLSEAQMFLNLLHGKNKGIVQLVHLEKQEIKFKRSYNGNKVSNALASLKEEYRWLEHDDVYISLNMFKSFGTRKDCDLLGFNALYTDLDFYKKPYNLTQKQAREEIERMIESNEILKPSLIINSGRGLQLIWLMDYMSNTAGYRKLWNRMQDEIALRFKHLNSDDNARSTSQIFRLVGTHSSRNGELITYEHLADRYSITTLKEYLLPNIYELKQKKPRVIKPREVKVIEQSDKIKLTLYSLAQARKNDLEKFVAMRNGNVNRRRLIFYYSVITLEVYIGDEQRLLEALEKLNERFQEPLPSYVLRGAKASAYNSYCKKRDTKKALYRFFNKTIIEALEINEDEQQEMKQLIGQKEKQRRNTISHRETRREAGMKTKEEYDNERKEKTTNQLATLKAMIEANPKVKNKVLADTLDVGIERIKQLKRKLKQLQIE